MKEDVTRIIKYSLYMIELFLLSYTIIIFIFKESLSTLIYPINVSFFMLLTFASIKLFGYVKNKKEELIIGHGNQKTISYAIAKKKEAEANAIDFSVSTFDRVSKYCEITLKRTSRIIDENADFFESLSDIDEVIIIGHSLNTVDMPYFKKVFNSISKNAIWKAYYFEDTDEKPFEKVLIDLGIRKENRFVLKTQELYL